MDAKALLEVGRTIPCPIICHLTVLRPENALIHAILRNMPSFFSGHRNLLFSRGIKQNGQPHIVTSLFIVLIILIKRGFAIPATLAEFTGDASSNPSHFHYVHFTAAGTDALHLRFAETFTFGHLIRLWVSIL
jgi:hypothetical protein